MPDANYVRDAFARIADRYVVANHVLSCGMDIFWRKKVSSIVKSWNAKKLLDIASGTGDLALEIQKDSPHLDITATDFCAEMLSIAAERGLQKTQVADALALPYANDSYDVVTVAFGLRNMADYEKALQEMHRVISANGHLLILDFSLPENILRVPYRWYLHKILPHIASLVTGQRDAYEYLGSSIEQFPSGKTMCSLLESQGFLNTKALPLSCGIVTIYTAEKG